MKKHIFLKIFIISLFLLVSYLPASADGPSPPPPPGHSRNGNQGSPGGTGCPIDRTQGIMIALTLCLAYAGFSLYKRGQHQEETSGDE